jgi:putative transposase
LRATLSSTHTTYAQRINQRLETSGHLFQGRYASYAMDDAHMIVAARYIENNPVKAGMVIRAEDWPWSSARAHISGQTDGLTDVAALGQHITNWSAMLAGGLEAVEAVENAIMTGRPQGSAEWLKNIGAGSEPKRRGRPPKN